MTRLAVNTRDRSEHPEPDHTSEGLALISETSREVERLTFELSSVLSERKAAADWREAKAHSTFSWSGNTGHRPAADVLMEDEFDDGGVVPANTKAWLDKARRARRKEALRRALAWTLTVGVGGLIIVVAVFLLTGSLPDLSWLLGSETTGSL